jgi:hypothetical protein
LSADGYKYFNINRKDVEQKTARYNQAHVAMKFTENLSTGERKTTKGSETGSHVSPVSVKVTRTFNIFESISESISDSTVVAMKFTENLSTGIMGKTLRAEHAPNIVLDPNEVFRKKPKPLDKGSISDSTVFEDVSNFLRIGLVLFLKSPEVKSLAPM